MVHLSLFHTQVVPVECYSQNLRDMVSLIRNCNKSTCFVLITPPPVNDETMLANAKVWMGANFQGYIQRHFGEFCCFFISV